MTDPTVQALDEQVATLQEELKGAATDELKNELTRRMETLDTQGQRWKQVIESRTEQLAILHHLRQQTEKPNGKANGSLADFIAPLDDGVADYIGGFCVTTGHGVDELARRFEAEHDDYSSIMLKALADRLAESFAEYMHRLVRKELWGYDADEDLSNQDLIRERYRGIRPAPGYPACPDHTEKATLFALLDAPGTCGVHLTESFSRN